MISNEKMSGISPEQSCSVHTAIVDASSGRRARAYSRYANEREEARQTDVARPVERSFWLAGLIAQATCFRAAREPRMPQNAPQLQLQHSHESPCAHHVCLFMLRRFPV